MKAIVALAAALWLAAVPAWAQQVVDLPSRPGVTERMLVLPNSSASATVLLLTGGSGHVNIKDSGQIARAENFLVRTRERFRQEGFNVLVLDAPSDHGARPYLGGGFRDSAEHVADLGAVVHWARQQFGLPVWIVGTSRGTQSAAHAAEVLAPPAGPDGIVLTSTILLRSPRGGDQGRPVPEMDLGRIAVPVLVVHHEQDPCPICQPGQLPGLMKRFAPGRAELKTYTGGDSQGPACEPWSHHGYNGIEDRVVADIAAWIRQHQ
ncbi:MAG: alpha/beta hydrolase [Burkholderiales bacterium]|nr:alpha/beta hydrolase [Burkholderiales bacterium]